MNKALILKIADRIEQHPERFDQLDYGDGQAVQVGGEPVCKTPACIAGWAAVLSGRGNTFHTDRDPSRRIRQEARSALDLTQAEAGRLFDEDLARMVVREGRNRHPERSGRTAGSDRLGRGRRPAHDGGNRRHLELREEQR